ncbi:hypothetical protein PI125_g4283 [Phytophthora idaei]|nr:hypothetical protein PI125_g4283 [Phytophthora idaei]
MCSDTHVDREMECGHRVWDQPPTKRRAREPTEGDCAGSVRRYMLRFYLLQADTEHVLNVARAVMHRWQTTPPTIRESLERGPLRVGFFAGGARGNPGPGGSGSVFVTGE